MLVCFDATVLCGALRRPAGINFRLLQLAADGVVLDGFGALFDSENVATSPIGRSLTAQTWLHNKPIGEVAYHLAGRTRADLLDGLPEQLRVVSGEFDDHDVHLVAAAVTRGADVICSSNRRHLPEAPLAGDLEVIGPGRLAAALGIG